MNHIDQCKEQRRSRVCVYVCVCVCVCECVFVCFYAVAKTDRRENEKNNSEE